MNQIIKTECVDFKALVSKNSNISLNVQTKMITELDKTFTEEESRWYIANFYVYMNYHPIYDFPINLENVLKMMGFAHKKNAKRTLENNFTKDEDYKITLLPREQKQNAGRCEEEIMLNIDCFKNLCMMIKTDQGKAIRKYYVKLENVYNKIIKEEIENQKLQLEEKESQLATTRRELTKEKSLRNKMLNRRCFDAPEGEYIYIFQDNLNDSNSILKIGQTKNLILREQYYSNINKSGGIVFYKKCIDCSLIERLCHHMLDKFRENKMQEWFNVSLDFAKQTVSTIIAFFDSKNIESLIPAINTTINTTINTNANTNANTNTNTIDNENVEINNATLQLNGTANIVDKSNDFTGFLDTCCEINPDFFTAKEELTRAFRIYTKTTTEKVTKENLNIFLQNKFRSGVEFYENIRRNVWRGFRLRPLAFSVNDPDNIQDYEQFILDKCQVNYLNRISYVDFFEAFVLYKKQNNPDYILTHPIKQKIQMYVTDKFANGRVHLSDQCKAKHLFGVLGLSLQNISGLKQSKRTCKRVLQINSETGDCINTWDSLTIAAKESGIPRSTLSSIINLQTIKDKCTFKYI
jgi:phage anti-repressor protein